MLQIKKIIRAILYFNVSFYILWFLLNIALTKSHYIGSMDVLLIFVCVILAALLLKILKTDQPLENKNISFIKILLFLFAPFIIFGIPIVWYDLHSGGMFKGLGSYLYAITISITVVLMGTLSFFLLKKLSSKWVATIPIIIYSLALLYSFVASINHQFQPFYYLNSRLNPPQIYKSVNN